jgi:hypothetical protein
MAYGTINADLMTTSDGVSSSGLYGFKNKIINGAMVINQRGFSGTVTTDGSYTLDRYVAFSVASSKFSVSQNAGSVTPPVGFANYLGVTSLAATSLAAGDYYQICQRIEGYNMADLAWGTANAKTVTLSFQVYSSLTGTFGGSLQNGNQNRAYPFTYTISSANTWTTISITIAGSTDGTWSSTNTEGIGLYFGLGVGTTYSGTAGAWTTTTKYSATGATSVVGTNGATFYLTGVQLEVGSTATSFDYRPYGTEFALCQRYYQRQFPVRGGGAGTGTTGVSRVKAPLIVTMRASPTATISGTLNTYDGLAGGSITSLGSVWMTPDLLEFDATFASGSTVTGKYNAVYNDASANTGALSTAGVILSAEL